MVEKAEVDNMSNYILTADGELYHYGVPGMKWGVRRAQRKEQRAARKAEKRLRKDQAKWDGNVRRNWTHAYNSAVEKYNSKIDDFNARHKGANLNNRTSKATRKYIEDNVKMWNDIYTKELNSAFGKPVVDDGRKWCDRVYGFQTIDDYY